MKHNAYKTICLAALAMLAACTDELPSDLSLGAGRRLAARRIEKAEVTSRGLGTNVYFDQGTFYRIWAYKDNAGSPGAEAFSCEGKENADKYIDLSSSEALINKKLHIYGFTDRSADGAVEVTDIGNFQLSLPSLDKDANYKDYLRGTIYYDPDLPQYNTASYVVLPFEHILSEVNVKVMQQGKKITDSSSADAVWTESFTQLKIKEIRLTKAYTSAGYDIKGNVFTPKGAKDGVRTLWKSEAADGILIPHEIPDSPEGKVPAVSEKYILPTKEGDEALVLQLLISGDDAEKFCNDANGHESLSGGDVLIKIPIKDNTTAGNPPLLFRSNYSYNLIVTFQSDEVRVITITPQIYPFFRGEGVSDEEDYEEQFLGQPSVFDNIQWCDRYTGASEGNPTSIEEFIEATGFYYQKDRTIPFYPSEYTGYKYLDKDYWPLKDTDAKPEDKYKATYDATRGWYWAVDENTKVFYKYGGTWSPLTVDQMFNTDVLPIVKPVVSYWYPEVLELTGRDYDNGWRNFEIAKMDGWYNGQGWEDVHNTSKGEGKKRYCSTVKDFVNDDGKLQTYKLTLGDGTQKDVSRRLNYVMMMTAEDVSRTWERNDKDLPCPPGWRLPTKEDFLSVFPGSAAAGNLTFLNFLKYNIDYSTIEPRYTDNTDVLKKYGNEIREIYVHTPFDARKPEDRQKRLYPPLQEAADGFNGYELNPEYEIASTVWELLSPKGDPSTGYESKYVISKRRFNADEWSQEVERLNIEDLTKEKYIELGKQLVPGCINKPRTEANWNWNESNFMYGENPEWGVIYAIKKFGTNEAYRLRYRIETFYRLKGGDVKYDGKNVDDDNDDNIKYEAFVLVVEQYKSSADEDLKYKLEDIMDDQYFLRHSWSHPDATLYFPLTGMVGDIPMIFWSNNPNKFICTVYNYGIETVLLSNEYENNYANQAVQRLKIGGSNSTNQFIFRGMARHGLSGQVRPVRTFRSGGD